MDYILWICMTKDSPQISKFTLLGFYDRQLRNMYDHSQGKKQVGWQKSGLLNI